MTESTWPVHTDFFGVGHQVTFSPFTFQAFGGVNRQAYRAECECGYTGSPHRTSVKAHVLVALDSFTVNPNVETHALKEAQYVSQRWLDGQIDDSEEEYVESIIDNAFTVYVNRKRPAAPDTRPPQQQKRLDREREQRRIARGETVCLFCGNEFVPKRRGQKYCRNSHRVAAFRKNKRKAMQNLLTGR